MNQILSVEMQGDNNRNRKKVQMGSGKASTRSVIMFFCIILIIFGITISSLGIFSKLNNNKNNSTIARTDNTQTTDKPKIEAVQNASQVEVEVSSSIIISNIIYSWNDGESKQVQVNGTNYVSFDIANIPSGLNTLKVVATDEKGETETFVKDYVGEETAKVELEFDDTTGKLRIIYDDDKEISSIGYYYDDDEIKTQNVSGTQAEIDVPEIKQGGHNFTVVVTYPDGNSKKKMNKLYFPVVERVRVPQDGSYALLNASDERKIIEVKINLNGNDLETETPNVEKYERTLTTEDGVIQGENRVILTVKNSDNVFITTRTKWNKTN